MTGSAVGVAVIKDMTELIAGATFNKQGDTLGATIDPAPQLIPQGDFGAGGGFWLLGVYKQLLPEAVLIVVCRRNQKSLVLGNAGGDPNRLVRCQCRYDFVLTRHGLHLLTQD